LQGFRKTNLLDVLRWLCYYHQDSNLSQLIIKSTPYAGLPATRRVSWLNFQEEYSQMKKYSKIIVMVALIMLVSLSACERAASRPPVTTPTTGAGEVPFPVGTQDLSAIGTQTAIASTPLPELPTPTPQVLVATETPGAQPADAGQPTATADANAGGGVAQPAQPTQPAQPLVATPVVERPTTYTLKKGEFAFCIARRFDLDLGALLAANNIGVNTQLATGYTLKIPASGNWPSSYGSRALRAHPVDYTVLAGETVYSIACKFGDVTPEAILAVNGINEDGIRAGATIRIP
jgi:LysM repeat protein